MSLPTARLLSPCSHFVHLHCIRQTLRSVSTTSALHRHVSHKKTFAKKGIDSDEGESPQVRRPAAPEDLTPTSKSPWGSSQSFQKPPTRISHAPRYTREDSFRHAAVERDSDDFFGTQTESRESPDGVGSDYSYSQDGVESFGAGNTSDDTEVLDEDENEGIAHSKHSARKEADHARRMRRHNFDFSKSTLMRTTSIELPRSSDVNPGLEATLKTDSGLTFSQLGVHAAVVKCLHALGVRIPTDVQAKAIPMILERQSLIASAETGLSAMPS
ncbi:probable ATP-dependent RNA helicase ddx27 [Sycon ciliatum]|uniref:probable ATP-dependent RNA helicase ddx27 n=1 Tax=Sycon ciliatum TaxID=27933 RepID=UPI0031F69DAB